MTTEARAVARHVRVAPNKVRQVIRPLRGMSIEQAQQHLRFSPKGASEQVLKTLNSAVANAEHNLELDADDLFVVEVKADEGPTLRRFRPRAMGRAYRVRKRTTHITIVVGTPPQPDAPTKGRAATATKRTRAAAAGEEQE